MIPWPFIIIRTFGSMRCTGAATTQIILDSDHQIPDDKCQDFQHLKI